MQPRCVQMIDRATSLGSSRDRLTSQNLAPPRASAGARRIADPRLEGGWDAPPAASIATRWSGGARRQSTPGAAEVFTAWRNSSVPTTSGLLRMVDPIVADSDGLTLLAL